MKGIIFNQLENMAIERFGIETWDKVIAQTTLSVPDGHFSGSRSYPDDDLFALVATASRLSALPVDVLVREFGRFLLPKLADSYPMFMRPGMTAKSFLLTVDRVVHVEVRKLDQHAMLPAISYEDPAPDRLVLVYRSPRNLCELALGLIDGVATHYGEVVTVTQTTCRKRGDAVCRIECSFS